MSSGKLLCWAAWSACCSIANCSTSHLTLSGNNDISGTWQTQVNDVQISIVHHTNASSKHAWRYGEWEMNMTLAKSNGASQKTDEAWINSDWSNGAIIVDVNSRQREAEALTPQALIGRSTQPTVRYPGYRKFPNLGLYKLHLDRLSWSEARDECDLEQSYLAVVNSQGEAEAMRELLRTNRQGYVVSAFIGLSSPHSDGHFVSVLGERMEELGYDSWDGGQPHGDRRGSKCAVFSRSGLLSEVVCDVPRPYICEAWLMD